MKGKPVVPQAISVLAAYIVQVPYIYVTDVYLMPLPSQVVLTIILPKLLLENVISVLLCHFILFRIDITKLASYRKQTNVQDCLHNLMLQKPGHSHPLLTRKRIFHFPFKIPMPAKQGLPITRVCWYLGR